MKKYFDKGISMQAKTVQHEAPRSNDAPSHQSNDSNRNGASAAPPAYGIDLLDRTTEQSNPSGLPDKLKVGIENLSGLSMNDVRVHYNSSKPAQLQALAYTQGTDIHVGPRQERHVPHEAWHVVQQAQGRVQPTMQMKGGVPLNDDKGLEHEADVMGEKAVQMTGEMHDAKTAPVGRAASTQSKNEGYRSSALQMRSNLPKSSVTKPVIQRLPKTWGGEWFADIYTISNAGSRHSVKMDMRFTPGGNVDSELIGLTQTVRSNKNKKAYYINNDATVKGHSIQAGSAIEIDPVTKETDEGAHIDQIASETNPLYAVNQSTAKDKTLYDTPDDPFSGKHGKHFYNAKNQLEKQDAELHDETGLNDSDKNSGQIFETTALAIKGNQTGTYYGSVRWGWRTDDKGNFAKLPFVAVSQGVPSSTFIKSAEIWNASKSSTGADTVNLPIVDVKITTAPITGQYPPNFIGPPLQIPAGTRVQIIRNATPPSTNGEIKVVDGIFTGNTLEVTPADMANLRDERP